MEIGKKLKNARIEAGLTQEKAAEKIDVSRQTISNWENEKSYPDIISVIALSDLYSVSLDELLKGDQKMAEHLEESTNVVKSNKKLTGAILLKITAFESAVQNKLHCAFFCAKLNLCGNAIVGNGKIAFKSLE